MNTISAVLAVYNEEDFLADCLESVQGWVDEIVMVDGNSTDRSATIAKRFDAKIYTFENEQNFHINKQRAIERASCDWILQLDADERVSHQLQKEIKRTIVRKDAADGYWIPRKNYFLGRFLTKGGQYPDYTVRLYRRGKGKLPAKDVHEQAVVDGSVAYLRSPLLHYADASFARYLQRLNRYSTFLARQLHRQKTGKNPLRFVEYVLVRPVWWFVKTFIRHKGFVDGWQGFVFSFFSSLRFPMAYLRYSLGMYEKN